MPNLAGSRRIFASPDGGDPALPGDLPRLPIETQRSTLAQVTLVTDRMARALHKQTEMDVLPLPTQTPNLRSRPSPLAPKVLLYSHDTYGLGNIRRTLLLAETLANLYPMGAHLVVTGSSVAAAYPFPDAVDTVKLPSLRRVAAGTYAPRSLPGWGDEVRRTRVGILTRTLEDFAPDLVIVDKCPGGVEGELLPALARLRERRPRVRVVLGLRDILDDSATTRSMIRSDGWFEKLDAFYDEVWIFGCRDVFDPIVEYGLSGLAAKLHFCGYLARPTKPLAKREGRPRVVVAAGGGGDGACLHDAYLRDLAEEPGAGNLDSTLLLGPEMSHADRQRLKTRYGGLPGVRFLDFCPDPLPHYAEADVVVSMAGYNTVCELLSLGSRSILVPRCVPVSEQLIRARRLAARGCTRVLEPVELTPGRLLSEVWETIDSTAPRGRVDLDGLRRVEARVASLLSPNAFLARARQW